MTLLSRVVSGLMKAPNTERPAMVPRSAGLAASVSASIGTSGSQLDHMQAYGAVGWLFATVNRIAQATAAAEWKLYRRRGADRLAIDSHPLLDLWESVNPYYTHAEFFETAQQHIDLAGETFWLLVRGPSGLPVEMWPLRPDRVKPIPHATDYIAGYVYQLGSDKIPLEPDDIIHIRMPSPLDPYRGMGPVQALMYDMESDKAAAQWTRNFFNNSAEPGGVIELETALSDDEYAKFVQRWGMQHRGVSNAHRVAILENAKWHDRKITQRDMEYSQLRRLTREIVTGAFGMPAALLGVSETVNRANAEAAEVMFSRWVIRPRLARIRASVNTRLAPMFGPDLMMDFTDPTPTDKAFALSEATSGYSSGLLTLNEARARLGEGEVDGGDEFQSPAGMNPFTLSHSGTSRSSVAVGGQAFTDIGAKYLHTLKAPADGGAEAAMAKRWAKRLGIERDAVIAHVAERWGGTTSASIKIELSDVSSYDWDWWAKYSDEMVEELSEAFEKSLLIAYPEMMTGEAQRLAGVYAETRGARLLRLDGDMNIANLTRARVNTLVAGTIERGDSLGTLSKSLRNDFAFSPKRARLVARTETATALGQGQQQAAKSKGFSEKSWVTQGDALVVDVCKVNEAVGWISMSDPFPSGIDTIPQHPNCRCTVLYRAKEVAEIDVAEGLEIDVEEGIAGSRGIVAEARCQQCGRLVGKHVNASATIACPRCRTIWAGQAADVTRG